MLPFLLCRLWSSSLQLTGTRERQIKLSQLFVADRPGLPAESSLCCWERHQATSPCSCQTTKKKWKHDLWKGSTCEGWDWINPCFVSCLNMAPDTRRDHSQWISPAEGAEPGHLFCFRSQTLGVLNPGILYAISGCNEKMRDWVCYDAIET